MKKTNYVTSVDRDKYIFLIKKLSYSVDQKHTLGLLLQGCKLQNLQFSPSSPLAVWDLCYWSTRDEQDHAIMCEMKLFPAVGRSGGATDLVSGLSHLRVL